MKKTILSIILGFLIGILSNVTFNLLSKMEKSVYWIIVSLVIILCIIIISMEKKDKLTNRFNNYKMQQEGTGGFNGKKYCYTGVPNYIMNIKQQFSRKEIKKLKEWGLITQGQYETIEDMA